MNFLAAVARSSLGGVMQVHKRGRGLLKINKEKRFRGHGWKWHPNGKLC